MSGITVHDGTLTGNQLRGNPREAVLDRNHHQGWYGECFVQLLAAAAGFQVARPLPDVAGIDLNILGTSGFLRGVPLATVQVKSWSAPHGDEHSWRYRDLTEQQFNVLAGTRTVPAFLFLVVVPPDARDYTHADEHQLRLCYAAYWKSFADEPMIPNASAQRKIPVTVPRENLLTVESLTVLCTRAMSGQGTDPAALASTP